MEIYGGADCILIIRKSGMLFLLQLTVANIVWKMDKYLLKHKPYVPEFFYISLPVSVSYCGAFCVEICFLRG